jgi:hypothetical protein
MAHEKSKTENLKAIESLLPSLSQEEKLDLFAKFVEAGKNRQPIVTSDNFGSAAIKPATGSLKRSSDASKLSLDVASTKVSTIYIKN